MAQHRILFVCLGNICRSPMAEGVFRRVVEGSEPIGTIYLRASYDPWGERLRDYLGILTPS